MVAAGNAQSIDFHQATDSIQIRIGVGRKFQHELHQVDFRTPRKQLEKLGTAFELGHEDRNRGICVQRGKYDAGTRVPLIAVSASQF